MHRSFFNSLILFISLFIFCFESCKEQNDSSGKIDISPADSFRKNVMGLIKEDPAFSHYLKDSSNKVDTLLLIQRRNKSTRGIMAGFFDNMYQAVIFEIINYKLHILDTVSDSEAYEQKFYLINNNDSTYLVQHLFYTGGSMGNTPQKLLVYDLDNNITSKTIGEFEYNFGEVIIKKNKIIIKSDIGAREIKIQNKRAIFTEIIPFKKNEDIPSGYSFITIFERKNDLELDYEIMGNVRPKVKFLGYDPNSDSNFDAFINDNSFIELDINNTLIINNMSGSSYTLLDPYNICIINNDEEKNLKHNIDLNIYDNFKGIKEGKCALVIARWYILPIRFINRKK